MLARTFAPFVSGIRKMTYVKFICYNVIGGILWVFILVFLVYFFGDLDFVKNNFETVIFNFIGYSLLPMLIEIIWNKFKKAVGNSL